jgi:hypothetical protein
LGSSSCFNRFKIKSKSGWFSGLVIVTSAKSYFIKFVIKILMIFNLTILFYNFYFKQDMSSEMINMKSLISLIEELITEQVYFPDQLEKCE